MTTVRAMFSRTHFDDEHVMRSARPHQTEGLLQEVILSAEYPSRFWLNYQRVWSTRDRERITLRWKTQVSGGGYR